MMSRFVLLVSALFVGLVGSGWFTRPSASGRPHLPTVDTARAQSHYHGDVAPLLREFCWDCHGDGTSKGGLSLDGFTNVQTVLADRKTWERILANLRDGSMPPKKKSQPSAAQRQAIGQWIEDTLFPVDPDNPDPGRVTLRRLNRVEYNNTIRDLLGVDFRAADDFPQDDIGYGFDNIGDVLSLPPVLLERYLRAAHRILDEAIVAGPPDPLLRRFTPEQIQGAQGGAIATLTSTGEMWVEADLKYPGEYALRAQTYGDQAGDDSVRVAWRVDGREVNQSEVKARKSRPETLEFRTQLAAGHHRFSFAFLNDFYREEVKEKEEDGKTKKETVILDRNLHVLRLEVDGPYTTNVPPIPEFQRRLFATSPKATTEDARAREILDRFASRAWRRPAEGVEVERLLNIVRQVRTVGENFEVAVRAACTAVLVSPHFLFRSEIQPDPNDPRSVHPVNEYALASRLSYFLWSTLPDEELTILAAAGRLRANLDTQVRRMLQDPRSRALVDNFAAQWLNLRLMDVVAPDAEKYPNFDPALRRAMREETERFITYLMRADRPVLDLLGADYSFVNERLARHYGLEGVQGDAFKKVSLRGTRRGGLLTQASILTLSSNPTRTSPVKRGKYILENILGTPPPPAPANVPGLEQQAAKLSGTLRQRMEQHRQDPLCNSCHERMDAIGFGFENFDGIGAWRDLDGPDPIDSSGNLSSTEKFAGPAELQQVLLTRHRTEVLRCLAEKVLTYALGRGIEYFDKPALDAIVRRLEKNQFRFSELVLGVVHSAPFQLRRGDGDPTRLAQAN